MMRQRVFFGEMETTKFFTSPEWILLMPWNKPHTAEMSSKSFL